MKVGFRWVNDRVAQKLLAEGFAKVFVVRGLLSFGFGGAFLITAVGFLLEGSGIVQQRWWREACIGFLLGGLAWGTLLWFTVQLPSRLREPVCWIWAILAGIIMTHYISKL